MLNKAVKEIEVWQNENKWGKRRVDNKRTKLIPNQNYYDYLEIAEQKKTKKEQMCNLLRNKLKDYKKCKALSIEWTYGACSGVTKFRKCTHLDLDNLTCEIDCDNRKCQEIYPKSLFGCKYKTMEFSVSFAEAYTRLIEDMWECGIRVNYGQHV